MTDTEITTVRKNLPPLPSRMRGRPLDRRGYPVPWFVARVDGEYDFRVIRPGGIAIAVKRNSCWLCGGKLGAYKAFVIGPMCAVNRITAEPPSHRECAEFAVRACPFLVRPMAKRRDHNMPEGAKNPAGEMIKRNPGVTLIWITRGYKLVSDGAKGALFSVGEPTETSWWREGRTATRDEVIESIRTGLPRLKEAAMEGGSEDLRALNDATMRAMLLLPPEE